MKIHIISLYTLVYLILGSKYKIRFCHVQAAGEEIEIEDGSSVAGSNVEYVALNLDHKRSTDKYEYKQHGSNGNFYKAKGDYRFSKITCEGQDVWKATKTECPDRVYYDPSQEKPLLQLIYSDEEYKLPKDTAVAQRAQVSQVVPVKKDQAGKEYVQIPMPKSGDDSRSVRSGIARPKAVTGKIAVPVEASQQYAEFKMPETEDEGKGYVQRKIPKTDDEDATYQKTRIKASAVAATRAVAAATRAAKTGQAYVQMPLPKSGDETSSIKPNRETAEIGAPVVSQSLGYVQMPMPKTDEDDVVSTHGATKKHIIKVETVHTPAKVSRAVAGGRVPSHSQPLRSGVEDGQSFLEFGIPRTDNEGAGPVEGQDYLEFKLVSSGPEHGKAETGGQATLPKRKAIVGAKYQDHAMPPTTEAESELDVENDPDIQAMLQLIEQLKQQLDGLKQKIAELDARDAAMVQAQ